MATDAKVRELEARLDELVMDFQWDIPILAHKVDELDARLKHFEDQEGNGPPNLALQKVQAELNDVDARVAQLERPEVEDDAK